MTSIKTFVFLDLETTGLPSLEFNKTKITELALIAVQNEHLSLGVLPRVQNKLSLCFNPRKLISLDSERITGLSNDILEHMSSFSANTVHSINLFLEHNPKPICLVAHNGKRFDYPILKTEIEKNGGSLLNDVLCIDSLEAFRQLHAQQTQLVENESPSVALPQDSTDSVPMELQDGFDEILCRALEDYECQTDPNKTGLDKALAMQKINEKTPIKQVRGLDLTLENKRSSTSEESNNKKVKVMRPRMKLDFGVSFKLSDVYQRITNNREPLNAHRAEGDVQMLLVCAATLGDKFITWANQHARNF